MPKALVTAARGGPGLPPARPAALRPWTRLAPASAASSPPTSWSPGFGSPCPLPTSCTHTLPGLCACLVPDRWRFRAPAQRWQKNPCLPFKSWEVTIFLPAHRHIVLRNNGRPCPRFCPFPIPWPYVLGVSFPVSKASAGALSQMLRKWAVQG